jgi:uncharacterized protein YybS (DUF2232 family)
LAINFAVQENPKGPAMLLMVLVCAGITCGLQVLFQILGPFGVLLNPLLAFPIAYVCMRAGITPALAALALVSAVVAHLVGSIHAFFYVVQFGGASLLLPYLLRRGLCWFKSVVVCLLVTASLVGAMAVTYSASTQTSVTTIVASYIGSEVDKARQVYDQADLPADQLRELLSVLDSTELFLKQAYVGLACLGLGLVLIFTIALISWSARGMYVVPGVIFHELRMPEWLIWCLIAAGFGLMVPMAVVQLVALNILTMLLPVYFLQGIAIMTFFLRKKAFSTVSRVFAYVLVLVINPLPLLVTAIGVFDMWFDFRKPRVKTT